MFDGVLEHRAGPTKTVAGIEQAIDLRSVSRPLLDLVEVARVGDQWIGGLLVEVNVVGLRIGHGPIIDPTEPLLRGSLERPGVEEVEEVGEQISHTSPTPERLRSGAMICAMVAERGRIRTSDTVACVPRPSAAPKTTQPPLL